MKIPVCSLNETRYAETFEVFVERSLEYPLIIQELVSVIHDYLQSGFRMLDIGAGTGHLIKALSDESSVRIGSYTAFEPNPSHIESLKKTLVDLNFENYDVYTEPFSPDTSLATRFDFVLFSHSLYWMPEPARSMLHAAKLIDSGGIAMAFIQGPYGVHAMFHLFESWFERSTPMLQNNAISSHELIQGLRELGADPEMRILATPIDLTGLFEPEPEAKLVLSELLSFCLQLEFNLLPAQQRADIIQYVEGGCVEKEGKLLWYLPNAAVYLKL
jgi:SAM-dependent methyltransferase